ncbi:MAG: DHHW family protein [Oscillospiraceae bacterium]
MDKHNKIRNLILTAVFLLFVFGFAIAGLIEKDRDFSEMENRNLAQFPEFSFERLKSGEFTGDIESYMSDQVFLKDNLVTLKTDCERLMLKNYQNGVYFGSDGYYLQQYTENKTQIDKNINYINGWAEQVEKTVPIDFLLVPNSVCVNEDKLPDFAVNDSQLDSINHIKDNLSERINLFNAYDTLKDASKKGEQVFYKTDHHWTEAGAGAVFEAFMTNMGETTAKNNYDASIVRNDFYGTLYSKAPSVLTKPDTMVLPQHSDDNLYSVSYVKENKTTNSLIDKSFLDKKDKYAAFLGGNFSRVDIKSQNSVSDKKVLVLKDSYANAMIPYLADQYSEIILVDMRYYHFEQQTVSELIKSEKIDRVLMIYNMDFINSDDNFLWLS